MSQENPLRPSQDFNNSVEKSQALAVATNAITQDQLLLSEKVGAIKATGFFKKVRLCP